MPAPFAAAEARVNAAIDKHLANATADFGGGVLVDGIFDSGYVERLGIDGYNIAFEAASSALPAVAHGTPVAIGAVAYIVAGVHPSSWRTTLILERAA